MKLQNCQKYNLRVRQNSIKKVGQGTRYVGSNSNKRKSWLGLSLTWFLSLILLSTLVVSGATVGTIFGVKSRATDTVVRNGEVNIEIDNPVNGGSESEQFRLQRMIDLVPLSTSTNKSDYELFRTLAVNQQNVTQYELVRAFTQMLAMNSQDFYAQDDVVFEVIDPQNLKPSFSETLTASFSVRLSAIGEDGAKIVAQTRTAISLSVPFIDQTNAQFARNREKISDFFKKIDEKLTTSNANYLEARALLVEKNVFLKKVNILAGLNKLFPTMNYQNELNDPEFEINLLNPEKLIEKPYLDIMTFSPELEVKIGQSARTRATGEKSFALSVESSFDGDRVKSELERILSLIPEQVIVTPEQSQRFHRFMVTNPSFSGAAYLYELNLYLNANLALDVNNTLIKIYNPPVSSGAYVNEIQYGDFYFTVALNTPNEITTSKRVKFIFNVYWQSDANLRAQQILNQLESELKVDPNFQPDDGYSWVKQMALFNDFMAQKASLNAFSVFAHMPWFPKNFDYKYWGGLNISGNIEVVIDDNWREGFFPPVIVTVWSVYFRFKVGDQNFTKTITSKMIARLPQASP